jgi:ketosteroid isomerase-like protein
MTSAKKPVTKTGKLPKDIFGSTNAARAPKSEQELMKALDQLTGAYLSADTDVINRIYADDCIVTSSAGAVMTKADLIRFLKSGAVKYESYDRDDLLLRLYGTTAVISAAITSKSMSQGRESIDRSRVVTVWVKQAGKWRLVAGQGTPIPR